MAATAPGAGGPQAGPQAGAGAQRRTGGCLWCGAAGHWSRDCPERAAGRPRSVPFQDGPVPNAAGPNAADPNNAAAAAEAEPKRRKPGRRRRAVRVEDLRGDGAVPYVMGNFPTMFRPMFKVRLRPLLPRSSAPALWCGG